MEHRSPLDDVNRQSKPNKANQNGSSRSGSLAGRSASHLNRVGKPNPGHLAINPNPKRGKGKGVSKHSQPLRGKESGQSGARQARTPVEQASFWYLQWQIKRRLKRLGQVIVATPAAFFCLISQLVSNTHDSPGRMVPIVSWFRINDCPSHQYRQTSCSHPCFPSKMANKKGD